FDFSGSSSTSGPAGNIRTFNAGSVSVNTSAFSRDKSSGAWSTAYLGSYGGGLGVTDGSEGNGSNNMHTVDNIGQDNYVLFEFSQNVVVDSAFLGYVVGDSDMQVWIGTKTDAFNSHMTLSDSALASLGFTEVNMTNSPSPRLADFNAGNLSGNVLVIAADPGDKTPDDRFKIQNVTVATSQTGTYENSATVSVPGTPSDSDLSHYTNPTSTTPPTPTTGTISGTKFLDVTGNGVSDDDTPLAGTRIYLDLNNDGTLNNNEPSMTTGLDGSYSFTGLTPGTYIVREVVTTDYVRTGPALSDNYTVTLGAGNESTDNDFTNAETCDEVLQSYSFKVIRPDGSSFTTSNLRGKVPQGSTVQVTFTIPSNAQAHPYTLVSYTAPEGTFVAGHASQQVIFDQATGTFQPGQTYTLTVQVPNSYFQVDFVCGQAIDQLGPAGSNIFYTPQNRLISADNGGTRASGTGSLSGFVYVDINNNGQVDYGEGGIKNVPLTLTGTDYLGNSVIMTTTTDGDGFYKFSGLQPGKYAIAETQPASYLDGMDTLGTLGGKNLSNDVLSEIALNFAQNGENYNFGERLTTGSPLTSGRTATIGFWHNKNGQSLIKSLNGGSKSTTLGNWLGTTFPNLYGNLNGKSNADIAKYFLDLFSVKGQKTEAQVLATALAVYVTDSGKAGTVARSYGFTVTNPGAGNDTINIGSAGGTLGVSNNSTQTLSQILALTDSLVGKGGKLTWLSSSKQNVLNSLFDAINTKGDI
ncbi:MAG: SdrD B-like domain-containing protein, partial [Isosphaeraceae bacterium]